MAASNAAPDLNTVMAAVGYQVFAYLPLGSLICGSRSPMLTNTIFHDELFHCLGQTETLSLSQCKHLHKVTDDQLIRLVQNVIEVGEAAHPGYTRLVQRRRLHNCRGTLVCPCPIKVKTLDLSRCESLQGEAVHFCLKHMPGIERILLSNASSFEAQDHFASLGELYTAKLNHLDVSGCSLLNSAGIKRLVTTMQGKHITHLDLSGCADQLDDSVAGTIAFCHNLQCLNLAGSERITTFGVGIVAYVTRSSLRCLSIRGCKDVHLPKLLMAAADELIELAGSDEDHRALPPNFEGDTNDRSLFIAALCSVLVEMMRVHNNVADLLHLSRRYNASFKKLDDKWAAVWNLEADRENSRIFSNLETLDLGYVGREDIRLEGCLATISWLNGGKLRDVNLEGLASVSHFDLSVLGSASGEKLTRVNASAMTDVPAEHASCFFFHTLKFVRELDLSNCQYWEESSKGVALVFLTQLRSLKLDNTNVRNGVLITVLMKCKKLLRLSIQGCKDITSHKVIAARRVNKELNLLELDCRRITLDKPLREIEGVYTSLLRLNNRLTERGTEMLNQHQYSYSWRIGAKELFKTQRKRKRGAVGSKYDYKASFPSCCSVVMTGMSSDSSKIEQEMFACKTCHIDFGSFVCLACTRQCHEGHEIFSVGYGVGCCDCCIYSDCKCLDFDAEVVVRKSISRRTEVGILADAFPYKREVSYKE